MGKKKFNISDAQTADECDGITKGEYCKDCGCPNEICCKKDGKRLGAKQELEKIWELCEKGNMQTDDISRIATYISERLAELEGAKE